ncbi:hypothetical protein SP21_51 [Salmonella phage 21]|nr:hypothetical protein SP21_51 [Salmonella phage 21]
MTGRPERKIEKFVLTQVLRNYGAITAQAEYNPAGKTTSQDTMDISDQRSMPVRE